MVLKFQRFTKWHFLLLFSVLAVFPCLFSFISVLVCVVCVLHRRRQRRLRDKNNVLICRGDWTLRVTAACELPDGILSDKSVKGRGESFSPEREEES